MEWNPLNWNSIHWWIFSGILLLWILRKGWKVYTHPVSVLTRQASNMGWRASRTITDNEGYRNTCLKRDGLEVMISFKKGKVTLLEPEESQSFSNFNELERWLEGRN